MQQELKITPEAVSNSLAFVMESLRMNKPDLFTLGIESIYKLLEESKFREESKRASPSIGTLVEYLIFKLAENMPNVSQDNPLVFHLLSKILRWVSIIWKILVMNF